MVQGGNLMKIMIYILSVIALTLLIYNLVLYSQKLMLSCHEKINKNIRTDKLLSLNYKYFEWKGITNKVTSDGVLVEQTLHSGEGLFKDKEDLETFTKASAINLKWWREYD